MLIKDMFVRKIDRDIQGVIKVGQEDLDNIHNELDEYVVTKELQKHFRDFFDAYAKGIDGKTDKMGVWISGFFGSGKSHFLKILSYILANKEVNGRHAIDYFRNDKKITDEYVIGQIEKAVNTPTDVVLFNIDSKSDSSGQKTKDSILNVFLKVFNEMLGYSTNPHLADLERKLDYQNKYNAFKDLYETKYNVSWIEARHEFNFYKGRVQEVLVEIEFMTEEDARLWGESTTADFKISIEDFANIVNTYINHKGNNHHVVFLVDEVGQYVGDNVDLMLNLQTITEDLGRICQGKVWVIVTSQQDISSMTKVIHDDFSKIQGRFDTRLSLTSANVDEVIKLRILDKDATAQDSLRILYETKQTIINNLIIFNDSVDKRLYSNAQNFVDVYPFIPYQSDILGVVLNSIRRYGASGKHLSEGERSMLALFKQSAMALQNEEIGAIVPFNLFYDALEKFLDHSVAGVITRASNNKIINPESETNNFNIEVLKTLFMIKYVDEIEPNIDNITTLMVSNINQDRHDLRGAVSKTLKILENQMLIQRSGEHYIFLTDQEQEINRDIQSQRVDESEIIQQIESMIFGSILQDDKIVMTNNKFKNRYHFEFERYINDQVYRRNENAALKLKIITPSYHNHGHEGELLAKSMQEHNTLIVEMDQDDSFIEEIEQSIKIKKFLDQSHSKNFINMEDILVKKRRERTETRNRGEALLKQNLEHVKFYVNNNSKVSRSTDFVNNVMQELNELATSVFFKLDYIDFASTQDHIHQLLTQSDVNEVSLTDNVERNKQAVKEVFDFITMQLNRKNTVTMKVLIDRFTNQPYGFIPMDVRWIVTHLYVKNDVGLRFNAEKLSLNKNSVRDHIDYLTKTTNDSKLIIIKEKKIDERLTRNIKNVYAELFKTNLKTDDPEQMVELFKSNAVSMMSNINTLLNRGSNYPGQKELTTMKNHLGTVTATLQVEEVLNVIFDLKDDFKDALEDYNQVYDFFNGRQLELWDEANKVIQQFDKLSYELNEEVFSPIINELKRILNLNYPYGQLHKIPELTKEFNEKYFEELNKQKEPLYRLIDDNLNMLISDSESVLNDNSNYIRSITSRLNNLKDEIKFNRDLTEVSLYEGRIEIEINALTNTLNKEIEREQLEDNPEEIEFIAPKIIRKSMKEIVNVNTVDIETVEDIDNYITIIKEKLEEELKQADKIRLTL